MFGCILYAHILHLNILFRSFNFSRYLYIFRLCLSPCFKSAFQCVDFGHIIAQSRQNIGGCLCIALSGVADNDQVVVYILCCLLHGCNTRIKVTVLGSIHISTNCSRNMGSVIVFCFTDIQEGIIVAVQHLCCILHTNVLHLNILFRSFDFRRFSRSFLCLFFLLGFFCGCLLGCLIRRSLLILCASCHHAGNHHRAQQHCKYSFHDTCTSIVLLTGDCTGLQCSP